MDQKLYKLNSPWAVVTTTTIKVFEWLETFANFSKSHSTATARSFIFSSNKMCLYLSLPVFSHWQGRLDPRVMILGRTRSDSGMWKSGASRSLDRDLLISIRLPVPRGNTPLKGRHVDPLAAETRIMTVRTYLRCDSFDFVKTWYGVTVWFL